MSPRHSGKGGKGGRRKASTEVQVPLGQIGLVAEGGEVHGTPSDPNRKRGGAYAASSVIQRGTANVLRTQVSNDDGPHLCACGCGQSPSQESSIFMPGHDSKVRSMGKLINEGKLKASAIPAIAREYLEQGGMIGG